MNEQIVMLSLGSGNTFCLLLLGSFMLMDKASSMYLWSAFIAMHFLVNNLESMFAEKNAEGDGGFQTASGVFAMTNPSDSVSMNCFLHFSLFLHAASTNMMIQRKVLLYAWFSILVIFLSLYAYVLV